MVIFCLAQHGWMARQHGTVDWMAQSMALVVRWLLCPDGWWRLLELFGLRWWPMVLCLVAQTCCLVALLVWWLCWLVHWLLFYTAYFFIFIEQTLFFILDPLFSSMVACLLIGLGEYAHWTGWWKNMLVCWVVENMLIGW
uniref:Uncharacterized protein n=1 Tax=Meloidogyne enterolobii TaxID=390850 RepID=A0A6V7U4N2_MELEN|nr:unnamed protein product [Meloidogyne enterolobii]